jgi:hypothetical protein
MKIDSGESLLYSYLRHVKNCHIVQTNWKPSGNWSCPDDVSRIVFSEFERIQQHKSFIEVFKTGFEQVIKQTEIDVLGLDNFDTIYAVNVSFNELGINYGSKTDTRNRVIKNLLRAHLALSYYFPDKKHIMMFCSPKVTPVTQEIILDYFQILESDFESESTKFLYVSNEDFRDLILMETIECIEDEFDTNELFLRSFKLLTIYAGENQEDSSDIADGQKKELPHEKVIPAVIEEKQVPEEEPITIIKKRKAKKVISNDSGSIEKEPQQMILENFPVTPEALPTLPEEVILNEISSEKISSAEEDNEKIKNEIFKVKNRVPKWFSKPDQNNSKILIAFMELLEKSEIITLGKLAGACTSMTKFTGNYAQMINIADKNHGKVFNGNADNLELWEPVREFIIQEYIQFKKSYYTKL